MYLLFQSMIPDFPPILLNPTPPSSSLSHRIVPCIISHLPPLPISFAPQNLPSSQ